MGRIAKGQKEIPVILIEEPLGLIARVEQIAHAPLQDPVLVQLDPGARDLCHSGRVQILDSPTVAGAAPAWWIATHRLPVSSLGRTLSGHLKQTTPL